MRPRGCGARRLTGQSAQALRARSAAGAARRSGWGRGGAAPTSQESPRAGWVGHEPRSALVRDGGVGGAAPRRRRPVAEAAPAPPHPHPLPQGARGPDGGRTVRVGAWGRSPPHERKSEGGWVGHEPRSALVRDGACGGSPHEGAPSRPSAQPPAGDARGALEWLVVRRAPDPLTPTLSRKGRGGRTGLAGCGRAAGVAAPEVSWGGGQGRRLDSTARLCYGARGWFV